MEENRQHIRPTREGLIQEIEQRVADKILEPSNAQLLIKLITKADTDDEAIEIAKMGTIYKKTGFHFDPRSEKKGNTIKYFKKNEALSFRNEDGKPTHKLIVGDNYDALQNLLIQYRGMIDVIYIDPPYGKDSMGEAAKTNYENAITRDNLLSMLYSRINLAKEILRDGGVLFVSIDDRNYAYIKCLLDDLFYERNFIATYLWKKTNTPPALSKKVRKKYEYVLCYGKNVPKSHRFSQGLIDGCDAPLLNAGNGLNTITIPAEQVHFNIPDGTYHFDSSMKIRLIDDVIVKDGVNVNSFRAEGTWKWGQEMVDKEVSQGTYFLVKSNKFSIRYQRSNPTSVKTPQNDLHGELGIGTNEEGDACLKSILEEDRFDNPKPVSLIEFLINMVQMEDDITVLDFFAGSGTTGHAVMSLNQKDEGNRTFLLCTNNEITEKTPNGIVNDVTSKRLKRIMTGECYDGTTDFAWIKNNSPLGGSLDIYDIASVSDSEINEGKSAFDVIDETLYGKEKFDNIEDKIQWVCENFEITLGHVESDKEWLNRQEQK